MLEGNASRISAINIHGMTRMERGRESKESRGDCRPRGYALEKPVQTWTESPFGARGGYQMDLISRWSERSWGK